MAATIGKLFEHLKSVNPPEEKALIDIEEEIPKGKKSEAQQLRQSEDGEGYIELIKTMMPKNADKVFENIYIGGKKDVTNLEWLKSEGVTDILNVADSSDKNLLATYSCQHEGINYYGFSLSDFISQEENEKHQKDLEAAISKLEELQSDSEKKIVVSCHGGLSRSATTVLCFLIKIKKMTAFEAITQVRQLRDINPSRPQLIYVAKMHNQVFGFENIDVIDVEFPVSYVRQLIAKRSQLIN